MAKSDDIDVSALSVDELHSIRSEVVRALAMRTLGPALQDDYDSHSSTHSKHSPVTRTPAAQGE